MIQSIKNAIITTPEDGLLYLVNRLTDKAGFFVSNKHLLYVVSNLDGESSQSISTEFVNLNTNVDIHAFAEDQQFKSGKYNVLDYIPTDGYYNEVDLESFINLCSAHAVYMDSKEYVKFFYSLINIFQIPTEQAYKNLIGLFGELAVIKYIYKQTEVDVSSEWHKTGSKGKYDFVLSNCNLEVKSSVSEDKTVEVKHSQIFNNDNNYLIVVLIEKNNAGISINQLMQELLTAPDYCNNFSFAINLEKERKRISSNDAENSLLSVKEISVFHADCINPFMTVPDDVSSLSYRLDLSEKEPLDIVTVINRINCK